MYLSGRGGNLMHIWRTDSCIQFNIMAGRCEDSSDSRAPWWHLHYCCCTHHCCCYCSKFTLCKHCTAFITPKGRSDILLLERLHNSLALLHKYVTPRICPRKINDDVCNHPSSSVKNYQFFRHWNTVVSVTHCPVLGYYFQLRPFCSMLTKGVFVLL